jgi:alanine dehydrogenase
MKIGILRETKNPVDNRVALIPSQISRLRKEFPNTEFKVQPSALRAYNDDEYLAEDIQIEESLEDCDLILGIKEAAIETLLPNKHYLFFGHIAKKQEYNIPLFKSFIEKGITFSDYEYLVDENGKRLVAFGWYAGAVGVYYTLQGWGERTGLYSLPKPSSHFDVETEIEALKKVTEHLTNIKVLVTGNGRVSQGAQYILDKIGAQRLSVDKYLETQQVAHLTYCVASYNDLVIPKESTVENNGNDFHLHPENYKSVFIKFASTTDILLSCHFWDNRAPVYLSNKELTDQNLRIKMIGDVTCDIMGSIQSTVRSSTHDAPFYDYNPKTGKEEPAFSNDKNISVMAVDTCPNAMPRITSEYFGEKLIDLVLSELLQKDIDNSEVLEKATIVKNGKLTPDFNYLDSYVKSFMK